MKTRINEYIITNNYHVWALAVETYIQETCWEYGAYVDGLMQYEAEDLMQEEHDPNLEWLAGHINDAQCEDALRRQRTVQRASNRSYDLREADRKDYLMALMKFNGSIELLAEYAGRLSRVYGYDEYCKANIMEDVLHIKYDTNLWDWQRDTGITIFDFEHEFPF